MCDQTIKLRSVGSNS